MNLRKIVRTSVKSTVYRCRWGVFHRMDSAYTIVQAAYGSGATIGTNPTITRLARSEIRPALKQVARVCYVVVPGTTNASKSALRIGVGSALSLIHRILDSVECGINLSRRFLLQCRQIIPIAFKAEVVLTTDSLDLPTTFRTFCYRGG